MKNKGVSPVIATVLLVAIVIVLAAIIFLWARGFVSERIAKFDEPIERACERVNFEAGFFRDVNGDEFLDINNRGDVPIYGFNVKVLGKGEIRVSDVLDRTLTSGESHSIDVTSKFTNNKELIVVPVLLGETDSGKTAFTCDDGFGAGVSI